MSLVFIFISLGSRAELTYDLKNESKVTEYIDLLIFASVCLWE